jgi:hypothetical protein
MGDAMGEMKEGMAGSLSPTSTSVAPPAEGVPDMGSNAKNIRKYPIVANPDYIDDQYHYMIGKCAEFFIESTSNDLQRALVAKIRECVTRWKKLDEESYNQHFGQLLPSDFGADINPFTDENGSYMAMVAALDLAELLISQLVVDENDRVIDLLNDITDQFVTNADLIYFEGPRARVLSLFGKLTNRAKKEGLLQEWLHELPLSTILPMKTANDTQDQFFLRLTELMDAPSGAEERTAYNQKLATYYRSGYGQFDRAIPAFKSVRAYLRAEAKRAPSSSSQEVLNCASCGACVDAVESQCGFCGTRIVRGADGTKSKIDLEHLLPIKTQGDYIDTLSASDTCDNLKACRIDGTYEDDLDVFQELIAWYKSKMEVYDSWTEGRRVLEEFQAMLGGQFPVLAKKARGKSDRERQVTKLMIRWRRDCLDESCDAGMFANAEKKKAKWQEMARDELGFL